MEYTKPPLSYESQADLLLERGMVAERDLLIERLSRVSYYRLSGYWHPFKDKDTDLFRGGVDFETVWRRYTFDRRFRLLVLDAIERVEVHLRSRLAHELSCLQGPSGYEDAANLPGLTREGHAAFIEKAEASFNRSKEQFARHYRSKYSDSHPLPPYWALVETFDFGTTSKLFGACPKAVQSAIAAELGVKVPVLRSWIQTINTVRNVCAHHSRLWNRVLGFKPKIPAGDSRWTHARIRNDKVYVVLALLRQLLRAIAPQSDWEGRLKGLLREYPDIPLRSMGFPEDWETSELRAQDGSGCC